MNVIFKPSNASGSITAPPSKSELHRLLILAAFREAQSEVRGVSFSGDILSTLHCLSAMGVQITTGGNTVRILGITPGNMIPGAVCDCGESASSLRFLVPFALLSRKEICFTGSERLLERTEKSVADFVSSLGGEFTLNNGSFCVSGALTRGEYTVNAGETSQLVTGLMMALSCLDGQSMVRPVDTVSAPYLDITADILMRTGIAVTNCDGVYTVNGCSGAGGFRLSPAADFSLLSAFELLSCFGNFEFLGTDTYTRQGDRICAELIGRIRRGGARIDLRDCPDLAPVLFAAAALFGGADFTGTNRLLRKESDRLDAMLCELCAFGLSCITGPDRCRIPGGTLRVPSRPLSSHRDHRIAMALSVLLSRTGGVLTGAECVSKSMPDFFEKLGELNIEFVKEN